MLNSKKIIITGGSGFIGSNLAHSLCENNDVVVIDNLITGSPNNISNISGEIKVVNDDINNLNMLRGEFQSADYVLHEAALPSVQRSIDDPIASNRNNIDGTLNVLVAARDCGVKRIVFASSSAVYGDTLDQPKKETTPPKPLSPYAVTKLACEYYCKIFHDIYDLETISLRYFNVFGPRQDPNSAYAAVIPKFIKAIRNREGVKIYGNGEQSRDFVYVADVVMANILACESQKAAGSVINIASGKSTTINQLLEILAEIFAIDIEPAYICPSPGDIRHSVADIRRAKDLLGYEPRYDIKEALIELIKGPL